MERARIKVTNETNHGHTVKLLLDNGGFSERRLGGMNGNVKSFVFLNEDQFLYLYSNSRDFRGGFLSYDKESLPDFIKEALGMPLTQEEKEGYSEEFKFYSDDNILKLIRGKVGDFNSFVKEISELPVRESDEIKRRIFVIAEKIDNLNMKKAQKIEDLTGKTFRISEQLKEEKK